MKYETENLYAIGSADPEIVIVCDLPSNRTYNAGKMMTVGELEIITKQLKIQGYEKEDVTFVLPCPPVPDEDSGSVKRMTDFMYSYRDEFIQLLQLFAKPEIILTLGANAARQLTKRAVKITKVRGVISEFKGIPLLPVFAPRMILRRPEIADIFETDLNLLGTLRDNDYDRDIFEHEMDEADYRWVTDLQSLLDNPPKQLVADVETVGLRWMDGRDACPLVTVQLCWKVGQAINIPIMASYTVDRRKDVTDVLDNLDPNSDDYQTRHDDLQSLLAEAPPVITEEDSERILSQLRELLANPEVMVVGHNLKFDLHVLRNYDIEIANWFADTMQLAFTCDENMTSKTLDDCVQRWVPAMAGYAHGFNESVDKSRMDLVPFDKMLHYGCGDVDATFRLCKVLMREAMQDQRNWNTFKRIQMPGLRAFIDMECEGFHVDRDALGALSIKLAGKERVLYRQILGQVPNAVKRKHLEDPKLKGKTAAQRLSFTRDSFTADVLFSDDGFGLTPVMFTPATRRLPPDERIPSTSQDHMAFFEGNAFVALLVEYKKLNKMRTTYTGSPSRTEYELVKPIAKGKSWPKRIEELFTSNALPIPVIPDIPVTRPRRRIKLRTQGNVQEQTQNFIHEFAYTKTKDLVMDDRGRLQFRTDTTASGFWQYLADGRNDLHPSLWLHRTNTGRSASSDPNAQNFPKRGDLAKAFRKIFLPKPGWLFCSADYSQIELRLTAWMANETKMLEIYNQGGDIHAATAANAVGVTLGEFLSWKGSDAPYALNRFGAFVGADLHTMSDFYELMRHRAKGYNFGLIYGQWWTGLKTFMKTQYQTTLTDDEARESREKFFENFSGLERWHWETKHHVQQKAMVRSMHGSLRRLPSIRSDDEGVQGEAKRQGINAPVQRLASDMGVMALARFNRDCPRDEQVVCGFIHDDLITQFNPEKKSIETAAGHLKFYMESNPIQRWFGINPPLPILADPAGPGINLAEMPDLEGIISIQPDWYQPHLDA